MKRVKVRIDRSHSLKLLRGEAIAIKAPKGVDVIEICLADGLPQDQSFAKILDVVFNGRSA